jgi:small subunit ribosomal protein S9
MASSLARGTLAALSRAVAVRTPVTSSMAAPLVCRSLRMASTYSAAANHEEDMLAYREKPDSLSYFTGNYKYNDLLIELSSLFKAHNKPQQQATASNPPSELETPTNQVYTWKLRDKMSEFLGIPLTTSQWRKIVMQLNQLASLPKPLPPQVEAELAKYTRYDTTQQQQVKRKELDDMGRAFAVGRRKESSARCYIVEGEGKILVNGQELGAYFNRLVDREEVTLPFESTSTLGKYNAWIIVEGGGSTGQAQAIKLGLGKALLVHDPELKPTLRKGTHIDLQALLVLFSVYLILFSFSLNL